MTVGAHVVHQLIDGLLTDLCQDVDLLFVTLTQTIEHDDEPADVLDIVERPLVVFFASIEAHSLLIERHL